MSDSLYLLMVLGLVLGAAIGLLLRYVIFRASCALVDVDPSPFKSILVVLAALAIALTVGVPMTLFGAMLFNVEQSSFLFLLWCLLGLVTIWLILGLLYIPLLPVSLTKGILLSGYEIVLGVLLNSLLLGIVLVIYAVVQIVSGTGQPSRTELPPIPALTATQQS